MTLRGRLTLWYTALLALALSLGAGALYLLYSRARLATVDEDLARADARVARAVPAELDEGSGLAEAAADALEHLDEPGRALAIFDRVGGLAGGRWEGLDHEPAAWDRSTATVETSAGPVRVLRARHRHRDVVYLVGAAQSLGPMARELAVLRRALLGSVLFALLVATAGGWWITRATLRPLAHMAEESARITDRTPGRRLTAPHPRDELGTLARAFNDLLGRLEGALAQQRQFMADASHELRTPVSIARTAIDVVGGRPGRGEAEYLDALGVVAQQMRRLSRIVDDLFTLARADASGLPVRHQPLYLDELVADCVKETRVLAAAKPVGVDWTGPADLEIQGDELLLRQMLMNLLHNAVRYTPPAGSARVAVTAGDGAVEVEVTDTGAGVPEEDRERIFERFVRLDAARSGEGAGLGLPIARAIAEAHGGTLLLARSDRSGSAFRVRLPLRRA